MRFKGLDLNLLVALDVLLDEKSVSRAAERLHLTQPATSAALKRLRDYFNDPILTLHGKRMIPTANAVRIQQHLKDILGDIDSMVSESTIFDPTTSNRKFSFMASDYLTQIIFVPLLPKLADIAPNIFLEISPPADSYDELLEQGQVDFMLMPKQLVSSNHPYEVLFEEKFVVVGCQSNPLFQKPLTPEEFFDSRQIVVRLGRKRKLSISNQALIERKKIRETDIQVSSFLLAPEMVLGTKRITVMHERLAKHFAKRLPLSIADIPFEFPKLEECVQYNTTRKNDLGVQWLISQIKAELGV